MNEPRAIILAAGQGSRLRPLTNDIPKCLVEVNGKSILEHQLDVMNACGIHDITVVTGYRQSQIQDPRVKKVFNKDFESTNMVYSLMCVEDIFSGEVIVTYGDVLYSKEVLKKVLDCEYDITLASDELWQQYWEERFEDPLSDAESFMIGPGNTVLSLGKQVDSIEDIEGQFTGIMKFTEHGAEWIKNTFEKCQRHSDCKNNCWDSGRTLNDAYMTDILNYLSNKSMVHYVSIKRGWFEIDDLNDLKVVERTLPNILS